MPLIAEGNPDEEKIGAFGVGVYAFLVEIRTLFSHFSKVSIAYSLLRKNHLLHRVVCCQLAYSSLCTDRPDRTMDGISLEGQERPGIWPSNVIYSERVFT